MNLESQVNSIVNKYLKWEECCEESNISKDDDGAYAFWLKITSKEIAEEICNDLLDLCEDNEAMKDTIREYFEINT